MLMFMSMCSIRVSGSITNSKCLREKLSTNVYCNCQESGAMYLPKAYTVNWPWVYILCMLVGMSANSISLGEVMPKFLLKRT